MAGVFAAVLLAPLPTISYFKLMPCILPQVQYRMMIMEKSSSNGLVFGNPLHVLPQYSLPDGNGTIPRFLVEACSFLSQHLQTEGLFRKSGSAIRMKNLKAKLQQGDCSLEFTSASDVAGLLKQFFRELPEPIIPAGFQGPLCQAQQLQAEGERGAATVLLTCLMPRINAATMNYFLSFLQTVAASCGSVGSALSTKSAGCGFISRSGDLGLDFPCGIKNLADSHKWGPNVRTVWGKRSLIMIFQEQPIIGQRAGSPSN
ncbi:inactive Rho GTPase-activating protein 11B-like [Heterodontus francisci]|uniref:inactive Rho GTPase-activating protein 11B-like n=1 Tax=Heterodontus francisci TaxID=7792 RepID=UPI00355B56F4